MKAGFRGWLYRLVSLQFGLLGVLTFLTAVELTKFYGFRLNMVFVLSGLLVSFLLLMTSFFGTWVWKRYLISVVSIGAALSLGYLAFRPEVFREDVLKQLRTPPLTVDLLIYRGLVLRDDPARDTKIERMGFIYGFLKTFAETSSPSPGDTVRVPIPEAK